MWNRVSFAMGPVLVLFIASDSTRPPKQGNGWAADLQEYQESRHMTLDGSEEIQGYEVAEEGKDYEDDFIDHQLVGEQVNEKPTENLSELDNILNNASNVSEASPKPRTQNISPPKQDAYVDVFTAFNEESHVDEDGYHTIDLKRIKVKTTDATKGTTAKQEKEKPTVETQLVKVWDQSSSNPTAETETETSLNITTLGSGWRKSNGNKAPTSSTAAENQPTTSPWVFKKSPKVRGSDYSDMLDGFDMDSTRKKEFHRIKNTTVCKETKGGYRLQNCLNDAKVVEECRTRLEQYELKKNVTQCESVKCKYKLKKSIPKKCCYSFWCAGSDDANGDLLEDVKKKFANVTQSLDGGSLTGSIALSKQGLTCEDFCHEIQKECFSNKFKAVDKKDFLTLPDKEYNCELTTSSGTNKCEITPHCPTIKETWKTLWNAREEAGKSVIVEGEKMKYLAFRTGNETECSDSTVQTQMKKMEGENKEMFCTTNNTHTTNLHYMNFAIEKYSFCLARWLCSQ